MGLKLDPSQLSSSETDTVLDILRNGNPSFIDADGQRAEIPAPFLKLIVHAAEQLRDGSAVVLMAENEALTTQDAARYLGVSRQHVVNMLEEDQLPYHKVGSHRRVYFRDLKKFADKRDKNRKIYPKNRVSNFRIAHLS